MAANTLQIKRSAYDSTSAPAANALASGEMAISMGGKKLYVGRVHTSGGAVEIYHLPLLTEMSVNTTSFTWTVGSSDSNNNAYALALNANVAGDGLALSSGALAVNVDDSSIETNSDSLRVKASGVTNAMLAGSIANAKLANPKIVISDGSNTSDINLGGTLTMSGTNNEIEVTESAGTVQIGLPNDVTIAGSLTVQGTTTQVDSTVVTIDDPVFTLGGDSAPGSDDNKDRGIEFRYHTGSAAKVGFFGYDDSDAKFRYIPDASNSSEVFSGSVGSSVWADISASTVSDATIDCGTF